MINNKRLKSEMEKISSFGALPQGGITRLAFSNEEKDARDYVKSLIKDIGMSIREDAFGNIYAKLEGEENLPSVATGSHVDSVPLGGCHDGTLGVMCSLEAIRVIKEQNIKHKRPLELIIFSCEESSRFNMATAGSKVVSGKLDTEKAKSLKDKSGKSMYDAAKEFGCNVEDLKSAILSHGHFYSYVELHIEQGPVLEAKNIPVGIVTGIAAPIRYELIITGRADHSGATPMNMRADALVGASEIIVGVEEIASRKAGKTTVATVGFANAVPGVLNVIPGEVKLGIDIRDIDNENLLKADKLINELIENVTKKRGLTFSLKQLTKDTPVKLDSEIVNLIEKEAKGLGIETLKLPSGAGHDAMHMPNIAKYVGMIFTPCKDGISHNTAEEVNFEDVFKATEVLTKTLITLSNQ
ncbi:MAG: M20 family metallo-hydrolase [Campylobacteraceae bacterium]